MHIVAMHYEELPHADAKPTESNAADVVILPLGADHLFTTYCAACRGQWATAIQHSCSAQLLLLGAIVLPPVADALLPLPLPQLAQFLPPRPHPPPPPWALPTRPVMSQPHLKLSLPPPPRPLLSRQQQPAPPHPPPSSTQPPHQALLPFSPQAVSSQSLQVC